MVRPAPSLDPQESPHRSPSTAGPPAEGSPAPAGERPTTIAIVGTPGSGKSPLFERLTGRHAGPASGPITTDAIESAELKLAGRAAVLLDTPGISGLELCSEHEALTRAVLKERSPQIIIQCVDAGNLTRSLLLTAQLADLEIPMVVCLTMIDEALDRGQLVDPEELSRALEVPVVPVCPADGRGIRPLLEALPRARRPPQVGYPGAVQGELDDMTPIASRAHRVERLQAARRRGQPAGLSLWHMVQEAHRHWARELQARVTRSTGLEPRRSLLAQLADLALHPLGAWLFFGATLVALYLLISRLGAGVLAGGLERQVAEPIIRAVARWTGSGLLQDLLVGPFGLLSLGLLNAICTVLPILLVFQLAFSFLAEAGYFPLLAVQFDRVLRLIGLSGKAVLPMMLGLGCNSVAVQATRCLESPRQRLIACFLIALGVPCAVQLAVLVAIGSTVSTAVVAAFVAVVAGVAIGAGRLVALLLPRSEQGEFLVEIRPLRAPRLQPVLSRTGQRLKEFVRELLPLFLISAAVLQLLQLTGVLGQLRRLLAPIVMSVLGLPSSMADVLLTALARRDVAAVMLKGLVDRGELVPHQVLTGLTVMTLFVPCLNALLVMGRVVGGRRAAVVWVAVMGIAVLVGAVLNLIVS